jgi:hypothetical protein
MLFFLGNFDGKGESWFSDASKNYAVTFLTCHWNFPFHFIFPFEMPFHCDTENFLGPMLVKSLVNQCTFEDEAPNDWTVVSNSSPGLTVGVGGTWLDCQPDHYMSCVWLSPVHARARKTWPARNQRALGELAMHLSRVESTGTNQPWNDKTLFMSLQKRMPSDRSDRGGHKYQPNTIYWRRGCSCPARVNNLRSKRPVIQSKPHPHWPLLPCPTKLLLRTWASWRIVS